MTKVRRQQVTKIYWDADPNLLFMSLEAYDDEPNMVEFRIFGKDGKEAHWLRVDREKFLSLFTNMWPGEVAYEFKSNDDV